MDFSDLHTFLLVARLGSFSAAAQELSVPTSTISRRVTRLEDALGVVLFHRTARSITLTRAGEHLRLRCEPAVREIEDAERSLKDLDSEPGGVLRITAPPDLGSTGLVSELLVGFRQRWPNIQLEIDLTERLVDLISEGFDVALRPRNPRARGTMEGLMVRSLATMQAGLYVSPEYLKGCGPLRHPDKLQEHRWVAHRAWEKRGLVLTNAKTSERYPLVIEPSIRTNHLGQVLSFLLTGAGVGAIPNVTALRHVEEGTLRRVLPDWSMLGGQLTLVRPASRYPSPRVRAFIEYATEFFKQYPEPDLKLH